MIYVILPQALRNLMPQIGNNLIINIKDSCVLSVIGVAELLYKTKAAAGALYMNFETYTITMIMYFIMTFTCSRLLRLWEKKMDGADNFDLAPQIHWLIPVVCTVIRMIRRRSSNERKDFGDPPFKQDLWHQSGLKGY